MMSGFAKVLRMNRREFSFRAVTGARRLTQHAASSVRRPRWEHRRLGAVLADRAVRDIGLAPRSLADHFARRPRLFPLHPRDKGTLAPAIAALAPEARAAAVRAAEQVIDGRLRILGYEAVDVGHEIDWHRDPVHQRTAPRLFWSSVPFLDPAVGDHKIIWEINRHQHWLVLGRAAWLTGDSRYTRAITTQLRSWLQQNPPLTGVNWASMLELGFRALSWIWAMQFVLAVDREDDEWLPEMLVALDAQLEHVRQNLSYYYSPNTHLLGEALALYVAGRALPELRGAETWARVGRDALVAETRHQVLEDGGHAELSPHYHRYALDFYLLALAAARLTDDSAVESAFAHAAHRLARFARAISDDRGTLPGIGDDDGGQLFPICGRLPADVRPSLAWAAELLRDPSLLIDDDVPEEVFWLLGRPPTVRRAIRAERAEVTADLFPHTGYAVLRTHRGDHAVFDVGRHGYLNGGHAHADALSLVLTLAGDPVLVDPGTSTYTVNRALRDRMRSTAVHNTVTINGRQQSEPSGPFHWSTSIDARPLGIERIGGGVWVEGEHDGYPGVIHRRGVLLLEDGTAVVIDLLLGASGEAHAQVRWQLHPSWTAAREGDFAVRLTNVAGRSAYLAATAPLTAAYGGDGEGGWCAPVYGQLVPAWSVAASLKARLPFAVGTLVGEGTTPVPLSMNCHVEADLITAVVELRRGERVDVLTVASEVTTPARRPDGPSRVTLASSVHVGAR